MTKDKSSQSKSKHLQRFHYTQDQAIEKPFNWKQMLRLLAYLKPYAKTYLPAAIIAMLISTAVRLIVPILIGKVAIDVAINEQNVTMLTYLVVIIGILYFLSYAGNVFRIKWVNILGQNVIYDIRQHLFSHVQRLSHRFFDSRSAGSILVRIMNDINSLQELFTNGIINLLMDVVTLVGIIVILFVLSPKLALAIMVILPLMFYLTTKLRRMIRRSWQQVRIQQSRMNSHLNEGLQGMRITQSFSQEEENSEYFHGVNRDNFLSWKEATKKSAMFRPFVELSNAIGTVILISYGAYLILLGENNGGIAIGTFVSFAFFVGMFWEPISRLGQMYNQMLMAMAASERIFEFLDEQPNVQEKKDAYVFTDMKGEIVFDRVGFSYDEDRIALYDISLTIQAGETVALVGHTGSGKSTIANLISRFYDPTKGKVKIDGYDLQEVQLDSLRQSISVVLQDTFIFSGTIMENIRFGRPEASDEEVIQAAKVVGADEFIQRMVNGYETEVEERGNILSAGERQLLSFARALLANPRILILDEATASIDTETEVKIQAALAKLLKGRTAIIIAHRLSTIREADTIFVLENGCILESGNHDKLMKQGGEYYRLVKSQFQMLDAI
ncbi:ABC transporter ATP-binding protein/permease [Virgibacillus pantothenticus]|uniref:Multidrug ABC transporter ATP-binding protein n=1 Tax=Virgibacillus pantothenticus TaxID=1473 RepID=A0A0L0QN57_VIRPA|nr:MULTISPECIES: ABC transporter ATP-binding protein [Virgibacillus]API93740.1 multidrug ABC transporter ATP-binding protein [Virgibacillus sp. 6R]KNE20027.1 multidrug ABC transporter ATP-binding protein [Virgibacillus pantothenticus]MBS7429847.1 ABC transporter ATP-binding protein [Virgibacillus sp. 19R1-5]MBU8565058.1 ABC transporter ATP-binding protein/permease [Virgibacillus pantothenticus]MBU8599365.1 ABC transporter ATP-binding protein/permease [Virgibacillus pantothenticus]